jgi:predicted metal-dependent phosphoesterase TrpH
MKNIKDLHLHTNISDGTLSPYNLLHYLHRRGINVAAFADHETVINFKDYSLYAQMLGIKLIPAIEINVSDHKNYHFVGYGMKNLEFMEQYLQNIRMQNVSICHQVIDKLKDVFNIELDANEVVKYNHDGVLDKRAIAKTLIDKGYASDVKSVYDLYIGPKAQAYIPIKKITAEEAIDLVHACGGVICWAHPATVRKKEYENGDNKFSNNELDNLLSDLKTKGLDGLECFTSKTTPEESDKYVKLANKHDLIITGGSDFHNHYISEKVGCEQLTDKHVEILENLIKEQHSNYNENNIKDFTAKYSSKDLVKE